MEEKHRKALRKNRMSLIRDLNSKQATTFLYSDSILSERDKDEIEAVTTDRDRSEKLLDILAKRGPEAFPAFLTFLKENQKHLFTLLNEPSKESHLPVDNIDNSVVSPLPDIKPGLVSVEESGEDGKGKTEVPSTTSTVSPSPDIKPGLVSVEVSGQDGKRKIEVTSTTSTGPDEGDGNSSKLMKNPPSSHSDGVDLSHIYNMSHNPRGHALIINNKIFQPSSGMEKYPRNGTDVDAEALKKLFRSLGFETQLVHNASAKVTFRLFDEYANMDHSQYDCFMCAILSHGEEGVIYSSDQKIPMKELTSKFRGKLMGKPKLFFFQACQGFEYMDGSDQIDGGVDGDIDEVDAPGNNAITLPVEADFLYAYSTVPGYYSWRNSVRGSWFAQAIVSVFSQHAGSMDVLRMMTRVNSEVARQKSNTNEYFSDNKKQIPSIISQLRKELYFFPENVVGQM